MYTLYRSPEPFEGSLCHCWYTHQLSVTHFRLDTPGEQLFPPAPTQLLNTTRGRVILSLWSTEWRCGYCVVSYGLGVPLGIHYEALEGVEGIPNLTILPLNHSRSSRRMCFMASKPCKVAMVGSEACLG